MDPPATSEFTSPRANLIVSRNGFSVEVAHHTVRYEEDGRAMDIFAEWLATADAKIIVRRQDIRAWQGPHGEDEVTESERSRIAENMHRALVFEGWILLVE